uniref:Capsid protein n=1 Tax=Pygoscelis antarcticus TaxID=79643 RepID=A0A7G7LKL5_PYGAN|nr:capsid protein [Pygoscelis antarcticus]
MPRPRKFSGPLRPGTTSTRTRVAKKPRGGLNKVEKVQTKQIVKAAIKKTTTLKYFNSSSAGNTAQHPEPSNVVGGQHLKEVSVIGYSSTTNEDAAGTTQEYGSQDIVPLLLSRPFKEFKADGTTLEDEKVRGFALEAYNGMPKVARTMFSIERVSYAVADDNAGLVKEKAARSLPIMCRMIKIGFKQQAGTQQELKPQEDMFLDVRTNRETGIDDVAFTRLQAQHAKINSKKYKTISDTTFVINQDNIITPLIHPRTSGNSTNMFSQKNGIATKYITHNFQLSARKGGKLFYENPTEVGDGPETSTSGGARTLLLFHFWFQNAHNLVGGTNQEDSPGTEDIQIKFVNKSAFVDSQ